MQVENPGTSETSTPCIILTMPVGGMPATEIECFNLEIPVTANESDS